MAKPRRRRGEPEGRGNNGAARSHGPRELPEDAVVSLTPKGHEAVRMLLEAASSEVGYPVTNEIFLEAMQRMRAEVERSKTRLSEPAMRECLIKHLRELRPT